MTSQTTPDLHGRRALVTGASDGIGLQIAHQLAAAGAELILPVRNTAKGERAATALRDRVPDVAVTLAELDLSSLDSVARLADDLLAGGEPIHILVNNAGLMHPPQRQLTADGFEIQFGTNHLGHFALAGRLLPLLRAGGARVVSQTSIAAQRGSVAWDDLDGARSYSVGQSYRQSKIAVGLFGTEFQRRSEQQGWGITSTVSHPGVAPTSLLAARPEIGRAGDTVGVRVIRALSSRGILFGTPESAATPAFLAATDADPQPGTMYGPTGPGGVGGPAGSTPLYRPLRSDADAARMWQISEELTGVRFP